jgi:phosphoribosylaminoimidazole-succinocarboxamide synthase
LLTSLEKKFRPFGLPSHPVFCRNVALLCFSRLNRQEKLLDFSCACGSISLGTEALRGREIVFAMQADNGRKSVFLGRIDKARRTLENRRFSYLLRKAFPVTALLKTDLGDVPLLGRGKVRDLYAVDDALLLVATDRISAFDHVLATGIPGKGKILTQISLFWFELLANLVPNHLISADVNQFPRMLSPYAEQLEGRSMLVKRAKMFPIECVARGYLAGSGWKEYQAEGKVCGIALPAGFKDGSRLPEALFTPATKSQDGAHDENISFSAAEDLLGVEDAAELKRLTLAIYRRAAGHAESCGLILADTKFEFGTTQEGIMLADEVLTPDSSRFWESAQWKPGGAQPSFDKQFVRDYLESIHWNKQAPAPALPEDVAERTQAKYLAAFRRLTGRDLSL